MTNTEELETMLRAAPKLKLLQGGGGNVGNNWLSKMKMGTVFLAQPRNPDLWEVRQFQHAGYSKTSVLLGYWDQKDEYYFVRVDPERFCRQYSMLEVLKEPEEDEQHHPGDEDRDVHDEPAPRSDQDTSKSE